MSLVESTAARGVNPYRSYRPTHTIDQLGKRMREVRERRGYTQTAAARLCDVAKQSLSNWELGVTPPSLSHLIHWCAVMDIDVGVLFGGLLDNLRPVSNTERRIPTTSQLIPVEKTMERAGQRLMGQQLEIENTEGFVSVRPQKGEQAAFTIDGPSMEPRFCDGDTVVVTSQTMAEPDSLVFAKVNGRYLFRRFLPKVEGKTEGAILRALNPAYPDVEMKRNDSILGVFAQHVSTRQR